MNWSKILVFLFLTVKVCSLYSAEMPSCGHVLPSSALTKSMMQELYNGHSVSHNGNMQIQAKDTAAFQTVFPGALQILSQNTFISRIRFVAERFLRETADTKDLEVEYAVTKDTLGYGPFTFTLLVQLSSKAGIVEEPSGQTVLMPKGL